MGISYLETDQTKLTQESPTTKITVCDKRLNGNTTSINDLPDVINIFTVGHCQHEHLDLWWNWYWWVWWRFIHERTDIRMWLQLRSYVCIYAAVCEPGIQFKIRVPWDQGSWGQHVAHLGPTGPREAPCWPPSFCHMGISFQVYFSRYKDTAYSLNENSCADQIPSQYGHLLKC